MTDNEKLIAELKKLLGQHMSGDPFGANETVVDLFMRHALILIENFELRLRILEVKNKPTDAADVTWNPVSASTQFSVLDIHHTDGSDEDEE